MTHHRIWRLRNLRRRLDQLIRHERGKPRPDPSVIHDLERRRFQVKAALSLAEAGFAPAIVPSRHN